MKFVPAAPLVQRAHDCGYAVPALNTNGATYEITRAILEAAQAASSPVIVQVYEPNTAYRGFHFFVAQTRLLCDELDITVPVALQIDHGHSFESVLRAMRAGFTSVMFDASHEPLEHNITETRRVVDVARALGVSVEAEVGYVKGNEKKPEKQVGRVAVPEKPNMEPAKTTIDDALRFTGAVDVDMLAVSVGTTHGVYQVQSDIDYDLLAELREAVNVPLVQHGTCGITHDDLAKLAKSGMAKINFGEPFRFNYIRYFTELTDSMEHLWHPWRIMQAVKDRLRNDMSALIEACGSNGKA